MNKITKIWFGEFSSDKRFDILEEHDSVSIIIFNKTTEKLIFVKQFRPAVYHNIVSKQLDWYRQINLEKFPPSLGTTIDLCSGIVDKNKSWAEIAKDEILEEVGYDVPIENLEEIICCRSGEPFTNSKQFIIVKYLKKIKTEKVVESELKLLI